MRRILGLVVLSALVAGCLSTSSAGADPLALRRVKLADSVWLIPTGKPHVYRGYNVFAFVFQNVATGEAQSMAFAMKGKCRVTRTANSRTVTCAAFAPNFGVYEPTDADFAMDPTLQRSTLTLKDKRFPKQSVDFTGNGVTDIGYGEEATAGPEGYSSKGYFRGVRAHAVGHLFGDTVTTKHKLDVAWFGWGPDVQQGPSVAIRGDRAVVRFSLPRA